MKAQRIKRHPTVSRSRTHFPCVPKGIRAQGGYQHPGNSGRERVTLRRPLYLAVQKVVRNVKLAGRKPDT